MPEDRAAVGPKPGTAVRGVRGRPGAAGTRPAPPLSVIVPVLNEAENIARTLGALSAARADGCEVIVVDGGSEDGSAQIAAGRCDRVVHSARGRAVQMNAGARLARAPVLLFLHADTRLPEGAHRRVLAVLAECGAPWGRFDVAFEPAPAPLRLIALMMNLRSRYTGIATGDQAIFVRREAFEALGGYARIALMEDIELSRRLRKIAWPICLHERVVTSSRRWLRGGPWRTVALMWRLRLAYFLGADPAVLARRYHR